MEPPPPSGPDRSCPHEVSGVRSEKCVKRAARGLVPRKGSEGSCFLPFQWPTSQAKFANESLSGVSENLPV